MLKKLKARVYDVLINTDDDSRTDRVIAVFLMVLILLNVLAVVLETVEELSRAYGQFFFWFEVFSVFVFTAEYVLRLWAVTLDARFRRPVRGRLRYALRPLALIDLIAVLPFYLPLALPLDLRIVRMLRVFRLFRLFKLARYAESLKLLGRVFRAKKEELIVSVLMLFTLLLFSSSLMYVAENDAQPDKFGSIPAAMWWGVATLTTVGYGDVYPVTMIGKVLGAFIAVLGIGIFALPTGILATGFVEALQRKQAAGSLPTVCPHCGKEI